MYFDDLNYGANIRVWIYPDVSDEIGNLGAIESYEELMLLFYFWRGHHHINMLEVEL